MRWVRLFVYDNFYVIANQLIIFPCFFFICRGVSERQDCKRINKVFRFKFTNEVTDGSYIGGHWIEHAAKLSKPKSGFDLLNVPTTFGRCT